MVHQSISNQQQHYLTLLVEGMCLPVESFAHELTDSRLLAFINTLYHSEERSVVDYAN